MKKYIKPTVKKIEVDADILRMWTQEGFINLFRESLIEARKIYPDITQEAVFDMLNEKWCRAFNSFRYSSYESFKQRLNEKKI